MTTLLKEEETLTFLLATKKIFCPQKNCYADVGLVISLFDISEIGDSHIFPGDGSSHTRVVFRLLVFRPFIEEVLVSTVNIRIPEIQIHLITGLSSVWFSDIFSHCFSTGLRHRGPDLEQSEI